MPVEKKGQNFVGFLFLFGCLFKWVTRKKNNQPPRQQLQLKSNRTRRNLLFTLQKEHRRNKPKGEGVWVRTRDEHGRFGMFGEVMREGDQRDRYRHCSVFLNTQNHRMGWLGRHLQDHLVPPSCHREGHLPLRARPHPAWP